MACIRLAGGTLAHCLSSGAPCADAAAWRRHADPSPGAEVADGMTAPAGRCPTCAILAVSRDGAPAPPAAHRDARPPLQRGLQRFRARPRVDRLSCVVGVHLTGNSCPRYPTGAAS